VCISAKAGSPSEPIYLSKEEIGEILVRETERRRFWSSADVTHLSLKATTAPATSSKREDALQYKAFSPRDDSNIPNGEDQKLKMQAENCQTVVSRHRQKREQTKTARKVSESVSNDDRLSGSTGVCQSSIGMTDKAVTSGCRPEAANSVDNTQNDGEVECRSTDRDTVPTVNARLRSDACGTSAEAGRAKQKKKKTVTFSDDVELVASAGDVADPVDYMSYAASIGRHANSSVVAASSKTLPLPTVKNTVDASGGCCRHSDAVTTSDSPDEVEVENSVAPSGQVRCSLCRQQWIELTSTYCSDCSFYLSKLQMSS